MTRAPLAASAISLAALVLLGGPASAAEIVVYKDVPSARELECVLFKRCTRSLGGTRAVRFKAEAASVPAQTAVVGVAPEPVPEEPQGTVLGLNLQFAYDSTEILPDSWPYLQRLGEVLSQPENAGSRIVITGHTDTTGSDPYNLDLSIRRAHAVEAYLLTEYGIDDGRLSIRGMGESRPLPGLGGTDPQNRRVEFYAVQ